MLVYETITARMLSTSKIQHSSRQAFHSLHRGPYHPGYQPIPIPPNLACALAWLLMAYL